MPRLIPRRGKYIQNMTKDTRVYETGKVWSICINDGKNVSTIMTMGISRANGNLRFE